MTTLCRRSSYGFLEEFYERCFFCGYTPVLRIQKQRSRFRFKLGRPRIQRIGDILTVGCLTGILLFAILQIPVPQTVFAFEAPLGSIGEILECISLLNFTMSGFSLNYSQQTLTLNILADYISLKSTSVGENITLYSFTLGRVLIHYDDEVRKMDMGLSSLTLNIQVNYAKLLVRMEGITNLPLWSAITRNIFG
jgi:hypothetical protein